MAPPPLHRSHPPGAADQAPVKPWSALAALNVPWAPGMALNGTASLGQLTASMFQGTDGAARSSSCSTQAD